MSSEVMSRIMKYIASLSELNNIKITWFGGEPLMGAAQIEELYDTLNATKKNYYIGHYYNRIPHQ